MGGLIDDGLDIPPHGWLIVSCRSGWEEKARKELAAQTYGEDDRPYEVYLPWCIVPRVRRCKRIESKEPLFPCYVFLAKHEGVSLEELELGAIRSTRGVLGIVSVAMGGLPNMIAHHHIEAIKRRCVADGGAWRLPADVGARRFAEGDPVVLKNGPFQGFPAEFISYVRRDKVQISVSLFGRLVDVFTEPTEIRASA